MIDGAFELAKLDKPDYIEEQGARYEDLTVWFNSLVDSAGGQVTTGGTRVVLGRAAEIAMSIMHRVATSTAPDPSLNVAMEGSSDVPFDHRDAAFEINYPFVYQSAIATNPAIAKQMGWAPFPEVVCGRATHVSIGGHNLVASAHSAHPTLAFDGISCLTKEQYEIAYWVKGGLASVRTAVYGIPSFDRAYPCHALIESQLRTYGIRPQTRSYADATLAIQKAVTAKPASRLTPAGLASSPERDAAITSAVDGGVRPACALGSNRPCRTSPNSSAIEGNRISPPAITATMISTSVSCGAGACSTVRQGRTWAAGRPPTRR